jgi:hypothetical protein
MRNTRAFRIVVAVLAAFLLVGLLGQAALAQTQPTYPPTTPPSVLPTTEKPEVKPEVEEEAEEALAFTGAELTLLLAAFGILVAAGAVALIAARRRGAGSS